VPSVTNTRHRALSCCVIVRRSVAAGRYSTDISPGLRPHALLGTVHSIKQHLPPKDAYVAVKYRDHWFYIDDRDGASKITFSLMLTMSRVNLLGTRRTGAPVPTLPVGR